MKFDRPDPTDTPPVTEPIDDEAGFSTSVASTPDDDSFRQDLIRDLGDCLSRLGRFWGESQLAPIVDEEVIDPSQFERYELRELVGQGGFGLVFRAYDPVLGRIVALKVPRPEVLMAPKLKGRFLREARAAAALDHPNIVSVHDAGQVGPLCYIASAFCEGTTLATWLRDNPSPDPIQAVGVIRTIALALAHAHERGILHRDLKPSNILLQGDPHSPSLDHFVPKISDFGLAKIAEDESDMTHTNMPIGSPPYMAPEQATGRLDGIGPESDVYALGATLYHLLAGRPPFQGQSRTDLLHQIVTDAPISPRLFRRGLSRDLETICVKCLEKEPRHRYPTAVALADDLGRFLNGRPIEARPASLGERALKWSRRQPLQAALVLLAGFALTGGIGALAWHDAMTRRHGAELEREVLRANRHAQNAESQGLLASRHANAAHLREARRALADRRPELAQEILHDVRADTTASNSQGFAWRYLWQEANREVSLLWGHQARITGMILSPDSKTLLTQDSRGSAYLWDMNSDIALTRPRLELTINLSERCEWHFSRDGKSLALILRSRDDDGPHWEMGYRKYNLQTGVPLNPDAPNPLASGEASHTVDPALWSGYWSLVGVKERPAINAEGTRIAMLEDGWITIRDVDSGRLIRRMTQDGPLRGEFPKPFARFSENSSLIGIISDDRVILWEVATGHEIARFVGKSRLFQYAISPSNRGVAILDASGTVTIHDRQSGTKIQIETGNIPPDSVHHRLAFSPDETMLAMDYEPGDHTNYQATVWEIPTGRLLRRYPGHSIKTDLQFLGDSRSILLFGSRAPMIWRVDPRPSFDDTRQIHDEVWDLSISPDGKRVAIATDDTSHPETLKIWDAANARQVASWSPHTATASAICYSPDGKTLAVGSLESSGPNISIWDPAGARQWAFEGHSGKVRSVVYSPDGRTLASASDDRTVRLWDLATGRSLAKLEGHTDKVSQVAFSPDGRFVASSSLDATVRLWDMSTLRTFRRLAAGESLRSIAFSPDGKLLATASEAGTIDFWEMKSGNPIRSIHTESADLRGLIFSPDGQYFAAGVGTVVRLWDTLSGQELLSLEGHRAKVNALAISPGDNLLVSGDHAGEIRFWRIADQ